MKKLATILFIFSMVFLASCGGSNEEPDTNENPPSEENIANQAEDTEVLPSEELIKYFPPSIDGYTSGEPTGDTLKINDANYSSAKIDYSNNNNHITISLLDYKAVFEKCSMSPDMGDSDMKVDTEEELSQIVSLGENIRGWETYQKKSNTASLMVGIKNRFLLTIDATNQKNTEFLKEIAQSIDLKKLAEEE